MPLPMPEEEEKFRCPHGERNQALMLCSLDCDLSGAHSDRKAKADGRFIITSWSICGKEVGLKKPKNSTFRHESEGGVFGDSTYEIPWNSNLGKTHFAVCTTCFGATLMLHVEIPN